MGYFLWLNVSIVTTKAANVTANINASNTDMASPPGPHDVGHADVTTGCGAFSLRSLIGSVPTTLEYQTITSIL